MSQTVDLFRRAVDEQISLWATLREIEGILGYELDRLSNDVQVVASVTDDGALVSEQEVLDLVVEWDAENDPP